MVTIVGEEFYLSSGVMVTFVEKVEKWKGGGKEGGDGEDGEGRS
jgi:hypothetical protein